MASPRASYGRCIGEIRAALATADRPLSLREIVGRCPSKPTTVRVGCALHAEVLAGRAMHEGDRGRYRYRITADGRTAAANPNVLRRGRRRRTRNHRQPRIGTLAQLLREGRQP